MSLNPKPPESNIECSKLLANNLDDQSVDSKDSRADSINDNDLFNSSIYDASSNRNLKSTLDSGPDLQLDDEPNPISFKSELNQEDLNKEIKPVVFKLEEKVFDENELDREQEEQLSKEKNQTSNEKLNRAESISKSDNDEDEESLPIEMNEEWQKKPKHVFILSEAGKPIYSLHGNEIQLVSFVGLLQALVSIIECDNENKLKHIIAGDHKFVFLHRTHLILVCVTSQEQKCIEQIELELDYVYNQILSVVTLSLIEKIFSRHHNYDLRNKLSGTEKLLTNIINRLDNDFGMLLNCVDSYPLQFETRDQVARMIAQQINSIRYVIFGLLLYDNKLIALIRPKTKNIHPTDVHLLVNVITGLDTPKSAEFTWYPICLPHFDNRGIMYAYISHLDEQCKTCLILLTGSCDQEQSYELNECRKRIQQKLQSQNLFQTLNVKNRDISLKLDQIGVNELKHFLFKDNKIFQYFVSDYALPYLNNPEQQQRIFDMYQKLYHKLHNQTNSLRIFYMQQKYETILGWITSGFEIYATFSPLVTKQIAIHAINKLLDFTQKNKAKIFLSSMPTLQR